VEAGARVPRVPLESGRTQGSVRSRLQEGTGRGSPVILTALRLSVVVATLATALAFAFGTAFGWILARRSFPGREFLDAVASLPLILPPTVTGYTLLAIVGRNGLLGGPLRAATGLTIPFTLGACVIAATVMAFPFVVRAARVAFEEIDPRQR